VGAEVKSVRAEVLRAGQAVHQRFDTYLGSYHPPPNDFTGEQKRRELETLLQLVLADFRVVV